MAIRVVQLSTYDTLGGAARAAYRLHRGMLGLGHDSRMLVKKKGLGDDSVYAVAGDLERDLLEDRMFELRAIQEGYIDLHRTGISNTMFSLSGQGYDVTQLPVVERADVIHLHWVAGFQSLVTVNRLLALGKPVVWTLHDLWAFTGGCHYPAGCEGYRDSCSSCPQLDKDPLRLPEAILSDKIELFKSPRLTVAAPSRWMAECARESRVFRDCRIEVIPNSVETEVYQPVPKAEAKGILGINPDAVTILFGCQDVREKRKGFGKLVEALQYCLVDEVFQEMVREGKLSLMTFGESGDEILPLKIPVMALGRLAGDQEISNAYSGADIFALPSLEDNLPNTVLEAMSCGTAVVAFRVGGVADMVEEGATGLLASPGDAQELGKAILYLVKDPQTREGMGLRGREVVESRYPLRVQAKRYVDLYEDMLEATGNMDRADVSACFSRDTGTLAAPLVAEVGPHLKTIYDRALVHGLKDLTISLEKHLDETEADRAARLDQIHELGQRIEEIEADRAARLDQIHELGQQIEEIEADRAARLDQILQLGVLLRASEERLKLTEGKLEALEATLPVRLMKKLQPHKFEN